MIDKVLSYVMTALAGIGIVSLLFAGMIFMTPQPKTYPVSLANPTPCELKGGENAVEKDGKCYTKKGRETK
jgi:hypothetical protein